MVPLFCFALCLLANTSPVDAFKITVEPALVADRIQYYIHVRCHRRNSERQRLVVGGHLTKSSADFPEDTCFDKEGNPSTSYDIFVTKITDNGSESREKKGKNIGAGEEITLQYGEMRRVVN